MNAPHHIHFRFLKISITFPDCRLASPDPIPVYDNRAKKRYLHHINGTIHKRTLQCDYHSIQSTPLGLNHGYMMMSKLFDYLFYRKRVCPWWICFTFDNVLRKLFHDPDQILRPYINEGSVVLDIGPGMGYFSIPLAKMVGENGRVIAADIQERMLSALEKRAKRSGVQQRITLHLCFSDSLGVTSKVDFILAFWMMHEVPDQQRFLAELLASLKDNGAFLLVEPKIHTAKADFAETVYLASQAGFTLCENPEIFLSRCALFKKAKK